MKNKNAKDTEKTIVYFLGYSTISFVLLIGMSILVFSLFEEQELMATIEAISTAVAAAAVFGAGYIAYKELSEVAHTRYMDIADRLFEDLNSPEHIEARRRIFQNLTQNPKEDLVKLKKEDRDAMKKVLNSLDHVAFLTREGWIPDDIIMPWMHPMISKSWEKLEPYVVYERERRDEPYYYEHAGKLAERCDLWRRANLTELEHKNKWITDAL